MTGLLVHLLLLHLIVVGSGDACVLPAVASAAHRAASTAQSPASRAAAVDQPGEPAGGMGDMNMGEAAGTSTGGAPCGAPAGQRHAPQPTPGCQSMAPCAPAALTSAPQTIERAATPVAMRVAGPLVLRPHSRVTAPEPPPPKA